MSDVDSDSSSDVSEFTDVVMSFIATLEDTVILIRLPNQKRGSMDPSVPP